MHWFEEIIGYQEELPLVCPICGGAGYTVDTGGNKHNCGCKNTGGVITTSLPISGDTARFSWSTQYNKQ